MWLLVTSVYVTVTGGGMVSRKTPTSYGVDSPGVRRYVSYGSQYRKHVGSGRATRFETYSARSSACGKFL